MSIPFSRITAATLLLALVVLTGCSSAPQPTFQQEQFDTGASPFARNFNVSNTDSCEAARRALLSQGYMTTMTRPDTVDGTKNFQPNGDSHIVVEFHVVCTPGEEASDTSIIYVNAVQNGFALKKSDTSASVGLSVLGSLSLPIRSNNDAMVKISSETIPSGKFYDRFFALVDHYLHTVVKTSPVAPDNVTSRTIAPDPISALMSDQATAAPTGSDHVAAAPAAGDHVAITAAAGDHAAATQPAIDHAAATPAASDAAAVSP